jgi:hypothetical protein
MNLSPFLDSLLILSSETRREHHTGEQKLHPGGGEREIWKASRQQRSSNVRELFLATQDRSSTGC